MLDLLGAIVAMAAIAVNLTAILNVAPLTLAQRLAFAAGAGGWVGLATGLGAAGELVFTPEQPFPLVGVLFAAPLLAAGALSIAVSKFRAALLAIPMPLLIGLNVMRVLGVLFLILASAGRLSGPFPYSAAWGDIITGVFAVPLALAARQAKRPRLAIAAWNLFGTLDLFAAVGFGLTSANGSPLQLFHAGVGSEAMQHLPYCLVPTVLVPFYLISHGIIAAQLWEPRMVPKPA
jgi:hypothetical protein